MSSERLFQSERTFSRESVYLSFKQMNKTEDNITLTLTTEIGIKELKFIVLGGIWSLTTICRTLSDLQSCCRNELQSCFDRIHLNCSSRRSVNVYIFVEPVHIVLANFINLSDLVILLQPPDLLDYHLTDANHTVTDFYLSCLVFLNISLIVTVTKRSYNTR